MLLSVCYLLNTPTPIEEEGVFDLADAMTSFDTEYGKDYYAGWYPYFKKVHGEKTMENSLPNGFGYRPIYKRILKTN